MTLTLERPTNGSGMAESPQVLSASSVNTYLRCGKQWEFAYVYGVKSPPSLRMAIGLAGHKAVETNMAQKIDTRVDLPESDVLDAFSDDFDRLSSEVVLDEEKDENLGEGKDSGVQAVSHYHKVAAPLIQPIEVEKSVQFALNGIPWTGQVDLIDEEGRVRDSKFVAKNQGEKNFRRSYRLNMTGYALAYRQGASTPSTPVVETDTVLDVIVRTKTPQYVPISAGGPITDEEIRSFAATVEAVNEGISKGTFAPNGLLGSPPACTWCGYKGICQYYKKGDK